MLRLLAMRIKARYLVEESEVNANEIANIIFEALRRYQSKQIDDVTINRCGNLTEVILTTDNGKTKQDWVISSSYITESQRGYEEA